MMAVGPSTVITSYSIHYTKLYDARKIGGSHVTIKVHPHIADMLLNEESFTIELLEEQTGKRFSIIPVPEMHIKRYDVIWNE